MSEIEVNGKIVAAERGETLLKALERAGQKIPTLCYIKDLFPSGACRMCVVEVEGSRSLVPSCAALVQPGMKIKTHSPRVLQARRTILELLLASHPDDCLFCGRNASCELRELAAEYGVRDRKYGKVERQPSLDLSSPSIVRDQNKCILCGRCVRVCEEIMSVAAIDFAKRGSDATVGTAFDDGLNLSSCVSCGQCVMACPTGALIEQDSTREVLEVLADPSKMVVVQHAPAVSVTLGEAFDLKPGKDVDGLLVAALRRMGFAKVFDTSFTADLTIMEEGSELVHRIKNGGVLPMFTSCSPAWINFVEEFYPEFIPNLSSCKSPQQMMGAMIKSYYAEREAIEPKKIFSVSVMPCLAKKREATRGEMLSHDRLPDIDAVLSTRELARLMREMGIVLDDLSPEKPDRLLGERSSAGKIFGATGGVMEAALRSAYFLLTGKNLGDLEFKAVRGLESLKEASVKIGDLQLNVAVVSGLGNARRLLEDMKKGIRQYHFVEVMSCPGGCIAGGGQPYETDPDRVKARMNALYEIDKSAKLRLSHENAEVAELYQTYLGAPLGDKSHHLLHTTYQSKGK